MQSNPIAGNVLFYSSTVKTGDAFPTVLARWILANVFFATDQTKHEKKTRPTEGSSQKNMEKRMKKKENIPKQNEKGRKISEGRKNEIEKEK